jgi:hypothetical protein
VAAMAALVKQFRDIDAQIRAIDARGVDPDDDGDGEDDDEADEGWDPSKI